MSAGTYQAGCMDIVDISWRRVGIAIAMFLVLGVVWMALYFAFAPAPQDAVVASFGWDAGFIVAFLYTLVPTYRARRQAIAQTR